MAKQTRTRKPTNAPPESMTLAEVRKLLDELPGKIVRNRPVDCAWLSLAHEGSAGRGYQLCVILEPLPDRKEATPTERGLTRVFRMQSPECDCIDEEELRRVFQDPSLGEWYFEDECPSYYK